MKICFVASIKYKDNYIDDYKQIVSILKTTGDKVFYEHVMNYSQADINAFGPEKKIQFHKKIIDMIKKSDLVVTETTSDSLTVGYLISVALDFGKPTILMYKGENEPNILSTVEQSDKLLVGRYQDGDNLKSVLKKLLETAKARSDVRFNFFVSPKILSYLDWVAQERMIPRSVFLRNLIEREMKKDKLFKKRTE